MGKKNQRIEWLEAKTRAQATQIQDLSQDLDDALTRLGTAENTARAYTRLALEREQALIEIEQALKPRWQQKAPAVKKIGESK